MALTIADAELMMLPTQGEGAIIVDCRIQQRVALDTEKIREYADLYREGHDLGRLVVFQTDEGLLLADGFHRHRAAHEIDLLTLPCAVYHGSRRDALLYATSCNLHGKPLTNADKRKRVQTLLTDPEWAQWSDNSIARHCGVAHSFVGKIRHDLSLDSESSEDTMSPSLDSESSDNGMGVSLNSEISENGTSTQRTYTNRYGQVRTMETGAIGQKAPAPPPEVLELEPEDEAPATRLPYSGDNEWHTKAEILDPVRAVLGEIDLDPASCEVAQARVQARTFYTLEDNGLHQSWHGRVYLNPPYGKHDCAPFIGKLCEELDVQHTTEAILVVNNATETDWFQRAFARANAVCFPDGRQSFIHATKNWDSPVRGQAILYFGPHVERFCVVFAALGVSTRVHVTDAQQAQLSLLKTPTFPDDLSGLRMGRDGRPMRARDYCILHLQQRHADFDHCGVHECSQAPRYLFWTQIPRPDGGPAWQRYYELCPAHTKAWCTAHQVDIGAIPTISHTDWSRVWLASVSDYDQLPWFRLASPSASSASTPVPDAAKARLRDQVGTLKAAVFQTVQQLQPCTNAQVRHALGEERNVVFAALKSLVQQGKIVKAGETYRVGPSPEGSV
jgi:hypothetical protein